jgi:superfamily I DNA and RNA helicase
MKAAHLHMANPGANILVTFYTRSLQFTLEVLITRFYRHYKDEDPDWSRIHVRHGWGGTRRAGVYSEACVRHGVPPLALSEARRVSPDPFDHVCRELLRQATVTPYYDFVLIDEGQDFPSGFYELVFTLASNERDRKNIIWAYDELQNILDVKIRSPHELFGTDEDGMLRIDLARAAAHLPQGVQNDIVLSKCYRNQREVLVIAHALGFGLYGNIVPLLQDEEHWNDVGYEVHSGPLIIGRPTRIFRPEENSSVSLAQEDGDSIVEFAAFDEARKEVEWIVSGIRSFIDQGLRPEDILVISLDDRNARAYFQGISAGLSGMGIASNNIIADPYVEPPFTVEGKVTLSTVYRAKGNEAAVVFALGIDAISGGVRAGRNKLFTAFTRSKAWLRVSGFGPNAVKFGREIARAKERYPYLEFVMPDPAKIETIQRDLSEKAAKARRLREEYVKRLKKIGISEEDSTDWLEVEDKEISGPKNR